MREPLTRNEAVGRAIEAMVGLSPDLMRRYDMDAEFHAATYVVAQIMVGGIYGDTPDPKLDVILRAANLSPEEAIGLVTGAIKGEFGGTEG